MNSAQTFAARTQSSNAEDPFDAPSYTEWVRRAVRLRATDPDLAMLFESTTSEPTESLAALIREIFNQPVSSRFVSAFADGNPYARRALALRYGIEEDALIITTGAASSLKMVLAALIGPGDEVLVEQPGFDVLANLAVSAGAQVRPWRRSAPDYRLDLEALEATVTPCTRVALITNLHNPTGALLSAGEIAETADRLARDDIVLVVDEVYADYAGPRASPPAATLRPNIVSVSSLTKVFGLFALKFGWLTARQPLLARLDSRAAESDQAISKLAHAVAAHVLEDPAPFESHWRKLLEGARPTLQHTAERLRNGGLLAGDVPPYGCMYFPRVSDVSDTNDLGRWLMTRHKVLVASGEYFGAPGYLRIGFALRPNSLQRGLERLEAGLRSYAEARAAS